MIQAGRRYGKTEQARRWLVAQERTPVQCVCCGIGLDVQQAACGHWFCYICRGRDHDQPNTCIECNPQ